MTKQELIDQLQHLEKYTHYSEDAPALREVIEMLKCSEMPNDWKKRTEERTETHACDCISRTDCEYCHEDSDGYVRPIEKNSHAFIRFGMNGWEISLSAKGWNGSAKIMYCPMCGRDLLAKNGAERREE